MSLSPFPRFFCAFAALTLASSSLSAGTIVFQRALPTGPGVNNAVEAARSNIAWTPGGTDILGDDFQFASDHLIDTLSVWEVSNNGAPSTEFSSIRLYTGADNGSVGLVDGSPLALTPSTYTSSLVSDYQYLAGSTLFDVYKISFSGLNWNVAGGVLYDFGIGFTPIGTNSLFLNASNAALSVSPQDGADNFYLGYSPTLDPLAPYRLTSVNDSNSSNPNGSGWDKSSNINVELQGTEVPEPATFAMFAFGAGALFFLRRRRA